MARYDNCTPVEFLLKYATDARTYFKKKKKINHNFGIEAIDMVFESSKKSYSTSIVYNFTHLLPILDEYEMSYFCDLAKSEILSDEFRNELSGRLANNNLLKLFPKDVLLALLPDYPTRYSKLGYDVLKKYLTIFDANTLFENKKCFCSDSIPLAYDDFIIYVDLFNLSDRAIINIFIEILKHKDRSHEMKALEELRIRRPEVYIELILHYIKTGIAEKIVSLPKDVRNGLLDIIDLNQALSEKFIDDVTLYLSIK